MGKLKVTQNRSVIKSTSRQKRTMQALGLSSRHASVELSETPAIMGMIEKVKHLVSVEKIK
ncbi:MAG: 50S ribosomal protein L30 [Saprospiraceae bacterium]|nr:50S ribosomal protein L30 [Saprospiraceae bacterium]